MSFSADLPFQNPNGRIFYACQAVLISSEDDYTGIADLSVYKKRGRNKSNAKVEVTDIKESFFLEGVQSVGVNGDFPSQSLLDVGKLGRQYHYYGQQNFEITIERKIDENQNFFYSVNPTNYVNYEKSHILYKENLGDKGLKDNNDNVLREFDVTILYTPDRMSYIGSYLDGTVMPNDFNKPFGDSNPYRQPPAGVAAEVDEPDADKVMSVTYLSCLLSSIDYNIGLDGVTETITLFTKQLRYNKDAYRLSEYKFSSKESNTVSNGTDPDTGASFSREKYTTMPHSGVALNSAGEYGIRTLKRENLDILKQDQDRKSKLPQEVKSMFELGNTDSSYVGDDGTSRPLKMLGINSIDINVRIDYTQLANIGNWQASEKDKEHEQNKYTFVNLPIQVTSSFTGVARRAMEYSDFVFSGSSSSPETHNTDNPTFVRNSDVNFAASGVMNSSTGTSFGGGPFKDGIDSVNTPPTDTNKTVYNKADRQIRLVFTTFDVTAGTDKYHIIDLGAKNYVTNISTDGGDVSGANLQTTITYQNDFSDIVLVKDTNVRDLINTELF